MRVTMIDAADTPRGKTPTHKLKDQVTEIVRQLEPGKYAVIIPEKGQSVRGLKSSFTRAGTRENRTLDVYDIDGTVYVGLVDVEEVEIN